MYPGPASGVRPIFMLWPPSGQVIGAATGEPLMPSPTSGSSPASMMPIFAGQPLRKAEEVQWAPAQAIPPVAQEEGSEEQPLALIAYTRPLAKLRMPALPIRPSEAVVVLAALISPSSPLLTRYSSLVPTTMLGGLPGPSRFATVGVSTILPWSSSLF